MTEHPITPPPHLIEQWMQDHSTKYALSRQAARWGADQELEACCAIALVDPVCGTKHQRSMLVRHIRERRRPKPPSLKEQALSALENLNGECLLEGFECPEKVATIRRALEALPE
jgi:hypothetical protein